MGDINDISKYEHGDLGIFNRKSKKVLDELIKYLGSLSKSRADVKTKHRSHRRQIGAKYNKVTGKREKIYGDYLKVGYFKSLLNKEFPDLWDWEPASRPVVIGGKLVITDGVLKVFMKERFFFLKALGVSADKALEYSWKKFYSVGGAVYEFTDEGKPISKSGPPKTANVEAFKKAINMATGLGDDTYDKDEDLIMSIEKIEEYAERIDRYNFNTEEKETLYSKLLGFQEYQMDGFFKTLDTDIPFNKKIDALDVLVTLNQVSIEKYYEKLKEKELEYTKQS